MSTRDGIGQTGFTGSQTVARVGPPMPRAGGEAGGLPESFRPLGARLLVKRDEDLTLSRGGLHIPEQAQEPVYIGTVVRLGTGRRGRGGQRLPFTVAEGDRVMISPNIRHEWRGGGGGRGEVEIGGERGLVLLTEDSIVGWVDETVN